MSLKITYALVSAAFLFLNTGCSEKKEIRSAAKQEAPAKGADQLNGNKSAPKLETDEEKAAAAAAKAEKDKKEAEAKESSNKEKDSGKKDEDATGVKEKAPEAGSEKPVPSVATVAPKEVDTKEQIILPLITAQSPTKKEKPQDTATANKTADTSQKKEAAAEEPAAEGVASDTAAIKKMAHMKISFVDLAGLTEAMKNPDAVIFRQAVTSGKAMEEKIKTMNEENFCRVNIKGTIHKDDYLKFDNFALDELDEANDVNRATLIYKNANGEVEFKCTLTTRNFFAEELQKNLQKWVIIYNMQGKKVDTAKFTNPRTEDRLLEAIKIKDVEKFKKVIMVEDSEKDLFALQRGEVRDMADAYSDVVQKKDTMSCAVMEVVGIPTPEMTYIRVAIPILEDTPKGIPNANLGAIYRADAKNFFILSCFMSKSESWAKLMETAKGVFEFGALSRTALKTKKAEMMKIQADFEKEVQESHK